MFHATTLLTSLLTLGISASPTPPPTKDACGPTIQVAGDPKDSCAGKPAVVTTASSFGILPIQDEDEQEMKVLYFDGWLPDGASDKQNCEALIPEICAMMNSSIPKKDVWHNKTYKDDSGFDWFQCQLDYWLPGDPKAAPVPSAEQCISTFQTMIDETVKGHDWYAATINLAAYPAPEITNTGVPLDAMNRMDWGYLLPGGSGTGKAVNSGYPSYILKMSRNPTIP